MSLTTLIAKLKEVYPTAERDAFAFSAIDSSLSIRVEGTDVHNSLRSKGSNEKSNKDQIDLTYGASHPTGTSPVHDFFPTIDLPEHLPQSRHLKISCKIWGECLAEKNRSGWSTR